MTTRLVRTIVACAALLIIAASAACDDDDNGDSGAPDETPAATTTRVAPTPGAATSPATGATPGAPAGNAEVVGIVGAVNQAENRIEINRLSGADVSVVLITPATRILSPEGRTLTLGDLRPSDRIIAAGEVETGEMTAERVEIQPVVPGASPGG
jgi:hypothetical protein